MLYVILYFDAETLRSHDATMREVVDKHFSDNWIIPVYLGHFVDLSVEWVGYQAATAALGNILAPAAIKEVANANSELIARCILELGDILTEGQLTEQYLLDHLRGILDCTRRCNAALRWRLLHRRRAKHHGRTVDVNPGEPGDADSIVTLMLKVSQLEYKVKLILQRLLEEKMDRWQALKQQVVERMTELSKFFAQARTAAVRVTQDKKMAEWFSALAREAKSLDGASGYRTIVGRKIQTFVSALEEVEHFDHVDTNLHIKALLADIRTDLLQMVCISAITPDTIHVIEAVSDLSYAWGLLGDYVPIFHERVRAEPSTAVLLRATFLKLASILDVPLVRIAQCDSPDASSVASYYSCELVTFVRCVLDVIPVSVFGLLDEIVQIQTNDLLPLPARVESAYLLDYAQLCARYQLARLTHRVAVFTESVLVVEKTLLGVICIDPRQILHDGLRKELVLQLSLTLDKMLRFPAAQSWSAKRGRISDFVHVHHAHVHSILDELAMRVDGYRRSVEYVQDYIDVAGLKMWQKELTRVIRYSVERECNRYLRRRVSDKESRYQSNAVPIPLFKPTTVPPGSLDNDALTFLGRTLSALLQLTTPRHTSYAPACAGWYKNVAASTTLRRPICVEICGIRTFQILERALGVVGLVAFDRILAFQMVRELTRFYDEHRRHLAVYATTLGSLNTAALADDPAGCYMSAVRAVESLMPTVLHSIQAIGHAQLLRRSLTHALRQKSRLDADFLSHSTTAIDTAILGDILDFYRQPTSTPFLHNSILTRFSALGDAAGLSDNMNQIYVAGQPQESLSSLLLLFFLTYAHKLHYDERVASLVKRKATYPIDGYVIVAGIHSILKQCHVSYTYRLVTDLGQFVCVTAQQLKIGDRVTGDSLPLEIVNAMWFIRALCRAANMRVPAGSIPGHILGASTL